MIGGRLYMEYVDLVQAGILEVTLKMAKLRGSAGWNFIDDPSDKRKALIEYEPLKEKYKDLIIRKYGDPFQMVKGNLLDRYVIGKPEDIDFLTGYRLENGKYLPKPTLDKYVAAAKMLNFLSQMANRHQALNIGIPDMKTFWELVASWVEKNNASLPSNVKRLQAKLREYQDQGPQCLIQSHFMNKRAAKVGDTLSESYLLNLLSNPNQLDDTLVCDRYNEWAKTMGLPTICSTTVWNYRKRNKIIVNMNRTGKKAWTDQFHRVIHRHRPSMPLALVNSDDNFLDLFFQEEGTNGKGHRKVNYYKRVKMVVVVDVFNNYPLGWAVGSEITIDLVREAYAHAVHHIYELTGDYHLWHQLQADNWAKKDLKPWYEEQAVFIESATGSSRVRRIESFFNHEWHKVIGVLPNYTGHNIMRGETINTEALEGRKKEFPSIDKAPALVAAIMNQLRHRKVTGQEISVQQQWLTAWGQTNPEQRRPLPDVKRLLLFGRVHSHQNTISNKGIILGQQGQRIVYDVPVEEYKKYVGMTFNIAYSPYDPSRILAYNNDRSVCIVCPVYEKYRDVVVDMQAGDRQRWNQRLQENLTVPQWAAQRSLEIRENLLAAGIDPETAHITGNMQKEIRQASEEMLLVAAVKGEEPTMDRFEDQLNDKIYNSYTDEE